MDGAPGGDLGLGKGRVPPVQASDGGSGARRVGSTGVSAGESRGRASDLLLGLGMVKAGFVIVLTGGLTVWYAAHGQWRTAALLGLVVFGMSAPWTRWRRDLRARRDTRQRREGE